MKMLASAFLLVLAINTVGSTRQNEVLTDAAYQAMARRIVESLQPTPGERVILRFDPDTMPRLEPVLRGMLEKRSTPVETILYGPAVSFNEKLSKADIYIWLPAGARAATPSDQVEALGRWLDSGKGRQVHFHWGDGTRGADGLNGVHSASYDRVYLSALDIDYGALDKKMQAAISTLRAGEVRVTTPSGTNLGFRVGDRPFCVQNGDASRARMSGARVRIDREIELPAGALRVAPIEESVNGTLVIPWARIDRRELHQIRLEFKRGVVANATSRDHNETLQRYLESGPGLKRFREFALGFNPQLVIPGGEQWLPYYGYGAGVVRLGVGDNSELGGAARGLPVRWLFFSDATVRVGDRILVNSGKLAL